MLLKAPFASHFSLSIFRTLGIHMDRNAKIAKDLKVIGLYENIHIAKHAEINDGCFFLSKDKIEIGENTTLAYQVTVLTSANPNAKYNSLGKIYPPMTAPVIIKENVWIGARAVILPGVTIGPMSVVAAGSVVNKDVPGGVVVAGIPARIIKYLKKEE